MTLDFQPLELWDVNVCYLSLPPMWLIEWTSLRHTVGRNVCSVDIIPAHIPVARVGSCGHSHIAANKAVEPDNYFGKRCGFHFPRAGLHSCSSAADTLTRILCCRTIACSYTPSSHS